MSGVAFKVKASGRNKTRLALPSALQELASASSTTSQIPASASARQSIGGVQLSRSLQASGPREDDVVHAVVPLSHAESALKMGSTAGRVGTGGNVDDALVLKQDLGRLPKAPSVNSDTYEALAIEDFGSAMLRGMGWKPGAAIGKSSKAVVAPLEIKKRPQLLGLGATMSKETAQVYDGSLKARREQVRRDKRRLDEDEQKTRNESRGSSSRDDVQRNSSREQQRRRSPSPQQNRRRYEKDSRQTRNDSDDRLRSRSPEQNRRRRRRSPTPESRSRHDDDHPSRRQRRRSRSRN
jgi:hypothetical protein